MATRRLKTSLVALFLAACLTHSCMAVALTPYISSTEDSVQLSYDPFLGSLYVWTELTVDSFGLTSAAGLFLPELANPSPFDAPSNEITQDYLFIEETLASGATRFGNILPRFLTFQEVLDDLDVTATVGGIDLAEQPSVGPFLCCNEPLDVFEPTTQIIEDAVVVVYDSTDGSLFLRSDIPVTTFLLNSFSEFFVPDGAAADAFMHVFDENRPDELFELTIDGVTHRDYGQVLPAALTVDELLLELKIRGSLLPHGFLRDAPGGGPYLLVVPEPNGQQHLAWLLLLYRRRKHRAINRG